MQSTGNSANHQNGRGGGTRATLAASGGTYGPAAAHAASIAPPVLFYLIGAWLYGAVMFSFLTGVALMLACWGVALYARRSALRKTPPDTYGAFQYKQAVVFAASMVGIVALPTLLPVILSIIGDLLLPIAIGYTFYGAYQVSRGRDFLYPGIGKRLSA
jgi:hypothetical protein